MEATKKDFMSQYMSLFVRFEQCFLLFHQPLGLKGCYPKSSNFVRWISNQILVSRNMFLIAQHWLVCLQSCCTIDTFGHPQPVSDMLYLVHSSSIYCCIVLAIDSQCMCNFFLDGYIHREPLKTQPCSVDKVS